MKRLTKDTIFESSHLSRDLAGKSVRGGITTMGAQMVQFSLNIVGTMVLARLLTPHDYGLVGMVTVVVHFAQMFKDAGLSMATVQRESISHEQISTLFWLNLFISTAIGLCVLACSPLVAWFYGKPELTAVMAVLSTPFLISGLTIQHQALLRRHMQFAVLAAINVASYLCSLVVTVVLALLGWRYWALVGGSITTALCSATLTLFFCPWRPGWMRRRTGVRGMLKFGGHLTGFTFFDYFAGNADSILIGRFIGADALGLYMKAYHLMKLPSAQIRVPLCQVAMPVLSSLRNQPERYVKYYQRLIDVIGSLAIPLSLYCAVEADFLVKTFLGQQWLGAAPVFRLLALAAMIHVVSGTRGLVLISHGYSKRFFYFGMGSALGTVASFAIGLPFGITGVAAGYGIAKYVILIPSLYYCYRGTPITVSLFLRTIAPPMLAGLAAAGSLVLVKCAGAGDSLASHIMYGLMFAAVYGGLSWCRASVRETLRLVLKGMPIISTKAVRVA